MITMYDALTIENIPDDANVVAGYVNGHKYKPTYKPLCDRFPNARHVSIATIVEEGTDSADFLDIEGGNAHLDQLVGWYRRQKARGVTRPGIYMSVDPMAEHLLPLLKREGIALSSVRLWSADYTGREHICGPRSCGKISPMVDGTQFTNNAHGRSLDRSLLRDDFFGEPPSVYTCEGHKSLHGLSQQLHNPASEILRLTAEHSPGAKFTDRMADYLNGVFAADTEKVPEGITVYHPDGTGTAAFPSHGTQTLQGLALAFNSQPSAIIRLTAEHSPGAVFSPDMAKYLNDVFSRSDTHVPSGIHLVYQK